MTVPRETELHLRLSSSATNRHQETKRDPPVELSRVRLLSPFFVILVYPSSRLVLAFTTYGLSPLPPFFTSTILSYLGIFSF